MAKVDKPVLDRGVIVAKALELMSQDGLDRLSMRKLGAELGVEAMSLYHYVDNKPDLLAAMADSLYDLIELPALHDEIDWETAVRSVLRSYYDVLVSHPGALELLLGHPTIVSGATRIITWVFELLRSVGMPPEEAAEALHFAVSFVTGHVATEISGESAWPITEDADLSLVEGLEVAVLYEQLAMISPSALFEAGLDMVIGGLRTKFGLS